MTIGASCCVVAVGRIARGCVFMANGESVEVNQVAGFAVLLSPLKTGLSLI